MKLLTATIIFILLLTFSVVAQNRKSDRETDGLKGSVKTVFTETAELKQSRGKKRSESVRQPDSAVTYDNNGDRLTLKAYDAGTLFDSAVYSRIDGDKVVNYEEVDNPNKIIEIISPPDGAPKKSFDNRYSYKFKYKYDGNGNVAEEAWYQSDGSLWLRYVYVIKGNKKQELVYSEDGSLNQKYEYVLDDKGNETEMFSYDTKKDSVTSKETYEYVEFDAQGNWTKRITSAGIKKNKFAMKPQKITYRKLTYF